MKRLLFAASRRGLCWSIALVLVSYGVLAVAQHRGAPDPSNLLTNPGLETGDFTGWTLSGNSLEYGVNVAGFSIPNSGLFPAVLLVHSGTYAGYAVVCGLFCNQYLDLSQQVNLVPGATYWAGFWFGDGTTSAFGNEGNIFVDGAPVQLIWSVQLEPGYQFVGGVFVATNSHPVIDFRIQGSGQGTAGLSFDDFCISGNPLTCQSPYNFQSIAFPGDNFTETLGINNAALIAGYHGSGASGDPSQGFVLTLPNHFASENFPGAAQTQVAAVNNSGNSAGSYVDQSGQTHGFVDIGGTLTTVDFPGTPFNQLLGLNDNDLAVGYYRNAAGESFPYTYQNGVFTLLDSQLPPHHSAQASGVNNSGQVSGTYDDGAAHGFLLTGASTTRLNYPGA